MAVRLRNRLRHSNRADDYSTSPLTSFNALVRQYKRCSSTYGDEFEKCCRISHSKKRRRLRNRDRKQRYRHGRYRLRHRRRRRRRRRRRWWKRRGKRKRKRETEITLILDKIPSYHSMYMCIVSNVS